MATCDLWRVPVAKKMVTLFLTIVVHVFIEQDVHDE